MSYYLEALWKIGLIILLSAVIGFERFLADKPAGIRTHILVGFGATLFMIAAEFGGLDLGRAAAGVITGIGFLGAGTIIRERGTVQGLTTAASIWAVAGIGIAVARGLWVIALISTAAVVVVLWGLGVLEKVLERRSEKKENKGKKPQDPLP